MPHRKGLPVLYLQVGSVKDYLEWYSTYGDIKVIVKHDSFILIKYKNKAYIYVLEIKEDK